MSYASVIAYQRQDGPTLCPNCHLADDETYDEVHPWDLDIPLDDDLTCDECGAVIAPAGYTY
jgi:hypothetical protein